MNIEKSHLLHWWHYYGKYMYTLAELEEFEKAIDTYGVEKIFDVAVASYIFDDGSPTTMLVSIKNNLVAELINTLPNSDEMDECAKNSYLQIRKLLFEEINSTMLVANN